MEALRDQTLPKLDARVSEAVQLPAHEPVSPQFEQSVWRDAAKFDPLVLAETYITAPSAVAASLEWMPPRITKKGTVEPVITDELRFRRAWSEATPEQSQRRDGLRFMRGHTERPVRKRPRRTEEAGRPDVTAAEIPYLCVQLRIHAPMLGDPFPARLRASTVRVR